MTQTLIEKLEALPRYEVDYIERGGEIYPDTFPNKDGSCVLYPDLRAIIEDAKAEKQEPIARVLTLSNLGFSTRGSIEWIGNKYSLPPNALLYAAPQPDIVAELVKALEDAREDVVECLNYDLPNKGWERYDRRIEIREKQIKTIDALLAKAKEMIG